MYKLIYGNSLLIFLNVLEIQYKSKVSHQIKMNKMIIIYAEEPTHKSIF